MTKSKTITYWLVGFILILGILLRTIVFSYRSEFEEDECRLILAFMDKSWWQMFLCLGSAQSAPPVFILIEKFLAVISHYNEYVMKSVPYICSVASLFLFYKLTGKYFQNYYSRLIAFFLFTVCQPVIGYSSLIKQYSSDVFVCLLCACFLPEIKILNLDKKGLIKLTAILILLPFLSLPSLFFIGAFIIINVLSGCQTRKETAKCLAIVLLPFLAAMGFYYFFNLAPSKASLDFYFPGYWNDGFINFRNLVTLTVINFKYMFFPNMFVLFEILIFISGLFFISRQKDNYSRFTLILFCLIFLASVLKLYPFIFRVALYSYPFFIITSVKPLDVVKVKSFKFFLLLAVYLISFCGYNFNYFKMFVHKENFINYSPKTLILDLKQRYNPDTDVILANTASTPSFRYYAKRIIFTEARFEELPKRQDYLLNRLEKLPNGKNYWFYLIKDYPSLPVFDIIYNWSLNENIIYGKQNRDSFLFVIKKG